MKKLADLLHEQARYILMPLDSNDVDMKFHLVLNNKVQPCVDVKIRWADFNIDNARSIEVLEFIHSRRDEFCRLIHPYFVELIGFMSSYQCTENIMDDLHTHRFRLENVQLISCFKYEPKDANNTDQSLSYEGNQFLSRFEGNNLK